MKKFLIALVFTTSFFSISEATNLPFLPAIGNCGNRTEQEESARRNQYIMDQERQQLLRRQVEIQEQMLRLQQSQRLYGY